ncbi:phospholipase D family protein [Mycobacterium colombiense]
MCAPFAKEAVVERVMSAVPVNVRVVLYTRWRPEEIAAGVSDTRVLQVVRARGGGVYLHNRLHAKFFRNENDVLLGSANLTATALGWSQNPNIELLVPSSRDEIAELEKRLTVESTLATEELAREVEEIAKFFPGPTSVPVQLDHSAEPPDLWIPQLRMPSDLYLAYSHGPSSLTSRSAAAATLDLAVLDLPVGLDKRQFELLVGHRLGCQPIFRDIDQHLERPRRFGEVRQRVSQITGFDHDQAAETWQTLMRWMLEFLPNRYTHDVKRHSEMFSRTKTITESSR